MSATWLYIFSLSTHKAYVYFCESWLLFGTIIHRAYHIFIDNVQVLIVMMGRPFLGCMNLIMPQRRMIRLHNLLSWWVYWVLHDEFAIEWGLCIKTSKIIIQAILFVGRMIAKHAAVWIQISQKSSGWWSTTTSWNLLLLSDLLVNWELLIVDILAA